MENSLPDFLTAYTTDNWQYLLQKFPIKPIAEKTCPQDFEGFYHYTTISSCEKLLTLSDENEKLARNKNTYATLFASHFLFLNDGQELLDGLERIIRQVKSKQSELEGNIKQKKDDDPQKDNYKLILKRLIKHIEAFESIRPDSIAYAPNHFILCFCMKGNLLSQWEWYGKECGIAIEYDLFNCEYDGIYQFKCKNPNLPYKTIPYPVKYKDDDKNKIASKLAETMLSNETDVDYLAMRCMVAASLMKHEGFKNELEMRLIFSPLYFPTQETFIDSLSSINYREANGVIKPYMKIHIKHKDDGKLPIKSVTVGPGHNQQLVYNAVIKMIQTRFHAGSCKGLSISENKEHYKIDFCEYRVVNGIEVRRSTIPFRG